MQPGDFPEVQVLQALAADLAHSWRALRAQPGFTLVALLTLSLALGANTAVFSALDAIVLRPLAYPAPAELLRLGTGLQSVPDALDVERQARHLAAVGVLRTVRHEVSAGGRPALLAGAQVSASLLAVLGPRPVRGRIFDQRDDRPDGARVALLSEEVWNARFGRAEELVGGNLRLSGQPYTILGILPAGFRAPNNTRVDVWTPLAVDASWALVDRHAQVVEVFARRRPGSPVATVQAELALLERALERDHPAAGVRRDLRPVALARAITGEVERPLFLLAAAVGVVALLACANLGSLVLVRAARRERELALRTALGASRARLVASLAGEGLLLAAAGALLGWVPAAGALRLMVALGGERIPRLAEAQLDPRAFAFTSLLALGAMLACGLAPAWWATRGDLHAPLRAQSAGQAPRTHARLRRLVVLAEVVACVVLLAAAGLLLRSFLRLTGVELGFAPQGLFTFDLSLPAARYDSIPRQTAFLREALARLERLPGVASAGCVSQLPLGAGALEQPLSLEGREPPRRGAEPTAYWRLASPGYFPTLRVRVLDGRGFDERDHEDAPHVALVNQAAAARFWPGERAVGKRLRWIYGDAPQPITTVVGVVADVRQVGLDTLEGAAIYTPYPQKLHDWQRFMTFALRTTLPPDALAGPTRDALAALDPELPLDEARSMESRLAESLAARRFTLLLAATFACAALALAVLGSYGLVAYLTAQRAPEIGLRLALGAERTAVVGMIVRDGLVTLLPALAAGLLLAVVAARAARGLLFDTPPFDPWTLTGVSLVLLAAMLPAWLVPARRAANADPLATLRAE